MTEDVLIRAEHVSKKFCRSMRRSLWYGLKDVGSALVPWSDPTKGGLRSVDDFPELRRDEFMAVKDVSFELRRGQCLGLIGHNGAGKSTLLKILNGLIPPDGGRITAKGRVAALIELSAGFNPVLTGRENIYSEASLLGFSRSETDAKFDRIVDFAEMSEFLDMPVQNYSSGMRVRLGFAVAAQMEPDIFLIDEILAVGDVAFRFKCLNAISELMRSAAVIFVSHTMTQIFRLCSELIVLDHGAVTFQGTDLAEGVSRYLSLFKEAPEGVFGSGEVSVESVTATSGNDTVALGNTLRIQYGSGITLAATLEARSGITEGRVQFVFWNAEMLPVMDVMADELSGYSVNFSGSSAIRVTAVVPRIELNGGKYTMSVIASSQDNSRTYCRYDNAVYLHVDAKSASGAHVLSIADWEYGNISESQP